MKKIIFTSILLTMAISLMQAQSFSGKGDQKLQAGFNFYGYGSGIKASYDYGLNETFSLGAGAVFYNTGAYHSRFFIFGRGDYHFQEIIDYPDELDVYIGAELGLIGSGSFGIMGHLGGRYAFTDKLYGFIEIGSNGAIGVCIDL